MGVERKREVPNVVLVARYERGCCMVEDGETTSCAEVRTEQKDNNTKGGDGLCLASDSLSLPNPSLSPERKGGAHAALPRRDEPTDDLRVESQSIPRGARGPSYRAFRSEGIAS